ncbi:hypothetical protein LJC08_04740 [Methanimicrococcus sp. OttesenSCG-928-J09]|nr:hypothetical protein [Methanimicrococcus sp. OttesenSCG-928-J09]
MKTEMNSFENHLTDSKQKEYRINHENKNNQRDSDFMINSNKQTNKKFYYCLFAAALVLMSLCTPAAAESFLPVMASDTLDYYTGYGEPELSASLRGNQEFGKGETANVQVSIANNGMLERLAYREYVIAANLSSQSISTDWNKTTEVYDTAIRAISLENYSAYLKEAANMNQQLTLANTEMQLEANRINAESLNIKFDCGSPYIEVITGSEYVFWENLNSGYYNVASVPIRISPNTPAGEYILNVTIDYQYPSNVKMIKAGNATDGFTTFMYSDQYVQEFETVQKTIKIPFYVSSGAVFEVEEINGTIRAGQTKTVAVTYKNVGDETAYNAECKIDMMYPLSSSKNKGFLGDVKPGESVTIEYPVTSHGSAMAKIYAVNSDVRYYDEDDKLKIAPSIKVNMEMINPFTLFTFKNALIGVIALIIISLVYDRVKASKKKDEENE